MRLPADVAIRPATLDDIAVVADVLATALRETEIAHWLVPDRTARHWVYRDYFRLVTPWFVQFATVHLADGGGQADGGAGAAVWASCSGRFEPDIPDYDTRLAQACGEATARFVDLDEAMLAHHPDVPHEYLAFLGVDPDQHNRGIGSALLTHHHAVLDTQARPAYLEATGPRNTALYRRAGYTDRDPYPVGPGGPPLRPMWRTPQTG